MTALPLPLTMILKTTIWPTAHNWPECLMQNTAYWENPGKASFTIAGDNTHPLKNGSKKIALYLKDKVAAILGW